MCSAVSGCRFGNRTNALDRARSFGDSSIDTAAVGWHRLADHVRWSRFILGFLLVFQAVFLNVIVPGHTRGQITLSGTHCQDDGGCPMCRRARGEVPAAKSPVAPSQRDREQCAVCQFVAGLTTAPVVRLTLPEMGLLDLLPVPPPAAVASLQLVPTYLACGPPDSAAGPFRV